MDYERRQLIQAFADEIRRLYDFSLCVPEKNYADIDMIADRMGGGIEYLDSVSVSEVARCGKGFVIRLPSNQKITSLRQRYYFAQGLAILFLGLKFQVDDTFAERPNLEFCSIYQFRGPDYENVVELASELYLPTNYLRNMVRNHCDANGKFSINTIADTLSIDRGYVENRLVELRMIKYWTER